MLNINQIKKDFPIFSSDPTLVYLDSTATSLKPRSVIEKMTEYYSKYSANVFRGIYKISEKATEEYEETRKITAEFIGSSNPDEVIFTRNATESLNLVAYSLGRLIIEEDDEVVVSIMDHHSNFVPWQQLAAENGATFKVIDITDEGYLQIFHKESRIQNSEFRIDLTGIISKRTKILALPYISNVLGTINPIKKIVEAAKKINPSLIVVADAAQAVPHKEINVKEIGADFVAFSSHKMLGPTGIGVLWGRYELLDRMTPFQYGGEMIDEVRIESTTFKHPPHKFEAGTPHIAGVIALKEAMRYLQQIGMKNIRDHEKAITGYAMETLKKTFGEKIQVVGPQDAKSRCGIMAFTFGSYHPHDIAQILDEDNIAIRAGHHCAMPLHKRLQLSATARASFYLYNGEEDVEKLVEGLRKVEKILK
ncbi:MAG: SufS family cysteine desulfurase [bacterium]|nr:SufS family cysteine desulfurase [bacterium]